METVKKWFPVTLRPSSVVSVKNKAKGMSVVKLINTLMDIANPIKTLAARSRLLWITLISTLLCSVPVIAQTYSRYDHAKAQYEQTSVDMRVKVLGGQVTFKRRYRDGAWEFNPRWRSLKLIRKGGNGHNGKGNDSPVERIERDQYRYKRARPQAKLPWTTSLSSPASSMSITRPSR